MKTLRFRRPMQVIYLEPTLNKSAIAGVGDIPEINIDLKVETVYTMKDAVELERKLLMQEQEFERYFVLPYGAGHGTLALQLLGHLFKLVGHAEEIEVEEPPVVKGPDVEEKPPFAIPEEVTADWLANVLSHHLKVPAEPIGLQDPHWRQVQLAYVPSMAKDLVAYHGPSGKKDLIIAVVRMAEQRRNEFGNAVIAVGVHETTEPKGDDGVDILRVYFKVRLADADGRPYSEKPINKDLYGGSVTT